MSTHTIASKAVDSSPVATRDPSWIARPRLLDMLRGGSRAANEPIVLVSAPAGAGKSVLVRQWLDLDEREHLEVALASHLNDPAALIGVLTDSLERIGPPAQNLSAPCCDQPGCRDVLLALEGLVGSRAADYVLVIEGLHVIQDPVCGLILRTVCEAMPPGSQVVLLSREQSPEWLARARAAGRLNEITAADISFDSEEVAHLFRSMDAVGCGEDVQDFIERAEGWAVALNLLARSIRRRGGGGHNGSAIRDAKRFIADYVSSEVLPALDPDLQSFVVRTSVLDDLSADLCDAVLEREDSASLLARLAVQLQLAVPVDAAGHRARYHHLLAETLRIEAARRTPTEISGLHKRAASWYADRDDLDSAIRHAKAAGNLSEVGRLVWSGVSRCIWGAETDRLTLWLSDLPASQLHRDRWLTLSAAWAALQSGETDRIARALLRAESHAGHGWRQRAAREEYAAALAVTVAALGRSDIAVMGSLCEAAGRGLPIDSGFRAAALFFEGVALTLRRENDRGQHCLRDAETLALAFDLPVIQADATSWRGVLALAQGDPRTAARLISRTPSTIRDSRMKWLGSAGQVATGQALAESLDGAPSAWKTLLTARSLVTPFDEVAPWFSVCGRLVRARAAVALGEVALARRLVAEAKVRMTPDLVGSTASDLLQGAERALGAVTESGAIPPVLSAAEIRVLNFLPSHLQMTHIGEHLFISKNTVKTHIKAIYRKLGVESRVEAVHRARELGMLEAPGSH